MPVSFSGYFYTPKLTNNPATHRELDRFFKPRVDHNTSSSLTRPLDTPEATFVEGRQVSNLKMMKEVAGYFLERGIPFAFSPASNYRKGMEYASRLSRAGVLDAPELGFHQMG